MTFRQRLSQLESRMQASEAQNIEFRVKLRRIEQILDKRLQAQLPPFSDIPDIEIEAEPEG